MVPISCLLFLLSFVVGPIALCSTVVMYLDMCIGLCHPLIVPHVNEGVMMMMREREYTFIKLQCILQYWMRGGQVQCTNMSKCCTKTLHNSLDPPLTKTELGEYKINVRYVCVFYEVIEFLVHQIE